MQNYLQLLGHSCTFLPLLALTRQLWTKGPLVDEWNYMLGATEAREVYEALPHLGKNSTCSTGSNMRYFVLNKASLATTSHSTACFDVLAKSSVNRLVNILAKRETM